MIRVKKRKSEKDGRTELFGAADPPPDHIEIPHIKSGAAWLLHPPKLIEPIIVVSAGIGAEITRLREFGSRCVKY